MQPEPERCGVCIVRVVRQATGLVITLTQRSDVDDASTQTQRTLTDVAETVNAVRDFILGLDHRIGDLAGDVGVTASRQTHRVAGFGSIAAVGKSLEMVLNAGFSAVEPIVGENARTHVLERPGGLSGPLLLQESGWAVDESVQLYLEDMPTEDLMRTFDSLRCEFRLSIPYIARAIVFLVTDAPGCRPGDERRTG